MEIKAATNNTNHHDFLSGGGEMEELIRSYNWAKSSLGPIESWPQCLKTAVNILLQSPVPMVMLWGKDGIMIYNDAYSVFAGGRHPFLLGSKVVEGWPEVADFNRNVMDNGLLGKTLSYKGQKLTLYRNNLPEEVSMDLNYSPIMDESGQPSGVLAIVVETTQRVLAEQKQKQAEEALRIKEDYLHALITATSDVIYRMNADCSELYYIDGRDFLADTKEPIKDWVQKYHHPKDQENVMKAMKEAVRTKSILQLEHQVLKKDGNLGWIFSRAIPILDRNGEIVEWYGAASDVTERKRAEEALRESELRFRIQADASPNFVWTLGPDGAVTYMNEYGLNFFNSTLEKLDSWTPYVHPDDIETASQLLQEAYSKRTKYQFEHRIKRADGNYCWVISTASPAILPNGELFGYIGSSVDITERKQMEEALKESEERFRIMADAAPNIVWAINPDSSIKYVNRFTLDFLGITLEKFISDNWIPYIHPDDVEPTKQKVTQAILERKIYSIEQRLLHRNGEYRWFLSQGGPSYFPNGDLYGYVGSSIDITERKQVEKDLESKNNLLVKINNDLDNFIYTASHDLKAPMSNIEGLLISLRSNLESEKDKMDDETEILFQLMEKSINRFKTTILDLTEISKVQKAQEEDVNEIKLAQVVEDVKLSIYDKIVQSKASVETDFSVIDSIKFSKKNLKSIFYNLLSNAIKYRDKNRTPEIFIKTEKADNYTVLIVKDNGLGINEQNKSKMFSMFKRFHDHVEGTGIGLYIVKRIIDNAGGKIDVESEVGKGTTFRIYFRK